MTTDILCRYYKSPVKSWSMLSVINVGVHTHFRVNQL